MEKSQIKPFIAKRVSKEINDGDFINLGIGLPTFVANFFPDDFNVTLHSENGMIGTAKTPKAEDAEPFYVTDAGGFPAAVCLGGSFIDSTLSFAIARGGHLDATVLGALQVDEAGNLASWLIPNKKVPGMGGAMDLCAGAKKVIVAMEHCDPKGGAKIMKKCSLPLTAISCVNLIVTERCVIEVTHGGLVMTEYNPEFSIEEILESMEANVTVSGDVKVMG